MALLSWISHKICHCRQGKPHKNEQHLQKAGEGGWEPSQPMGEHLGLVPSPVQQRGDYKGHRELVGVFWGLQHLNALGEAVCGLCMSTAPVGVPEEVWEQPARAGEHSSS